MSSHRTQAKPKSPPSLRHPAEVPLFVFMVILNVAIIVAIAVGDIARRRVALQAAQQAEPERDADLVPAPIA